MRFKAVTVLLGAVIVSSFATPIKFGSAVAADAIPAPRPEAAKVPEFVPVVNFGEFVMAMQTFAAQNPPAARLAAEALSAKFTSNLDAQNEVQETTRQAVAKPASIIVTRPVIVANILTASDSAIEPPTVPDPVKVVTGFPVEHAAAAPRRRKAEKNKAEKKATETSSVRSERPFQPAMGLGMVIDTAEGAPPISVLAQKKRKVKKGSEDSE